MQSRWREAEAARCADDLELRAYASRLLGAEPSLVLHGGGNTSVKSRARDALGRETEVLHVKGSGWDLATIEPAGFAPVRMDALLAMADMERLSDAAMVRAQRSAMLDPDAPNPSVEAILHALIPFAWVDHTHADAVVTLSNTPDGERRLRELYGEAVLIVPYVMPGFDLARKVREMTRDADWSRLGGMVLMHHGVFTFADSARESYERMIRLVDMAEQALAGAAAPVGDAARSARAGQPTGGEDLRLLARMRRAVGKERGAPVVARLDDGAEAVAFARDATLCAAARRGTLTPDHVIRVKHAPMLLEDDDPEAAVAGFARACHERFARLGGPGLTELDAAPRWALWPGRGAVAFGRSAREAGIVADIVAHTLPAVRAAEALGGWRPVGERELFEVEYWELEQAKLAREGSGGAAEHAGKVALVTGAASGIGRACAEELRAQGAAVAALDVNPDVADIFRGADALGLPCDITDGAAVAAAVEACVRRFGGLDIVVANAGVFPASRAIEEMDDATWAKSLEVNLTGHQRLFRETIPYLKLGFDPAVVIIASRNVLAPGPGAAAYSCAKAALTQLGRVAALELAPAGVRVNMLHPDCVYDTGIWTDEVLAARAASYGLPVEAYKRRNLLGVEVSSRQVARLVSAMAGPLFSCTTGAQLPVDGGNERVV